MPRARELEELVWALIVLMFKAPYFKPSLPAPNQIMERKQDFERSPRQTSAGRATMSLNPEQMNVSNAQIWL